MAALPLLPHLPALHMPTLPHVALTPAAAALRDARQLRRAMVEFYRGIGCGAPTSRGMPRAAMLDS